MDRDYLKRCGQTLRQCVAERAKSDREDAAGEARFGGAYQHSGRAMNTTAQRVIWNQIRAETLREVRKHRRAGAARGPPPRACVVTVATIM